MGQAFADNGCFDNLYKKNGATSWDLSDFTNVTGIGSKLTPHTTATRPISPTTGYTGFNSTIGNLETWNGASWVPSSNLQVWTSATRPASPTVGLQGYNVSVGYTEVWNGSAWVTASGYDPTAAPPSVSEGDTVYQGSPLTDANGNLLRWNGVQYVYTTGQTLQRILWETDGTDVVAPAGFVANAGLNNAFIPKSSTSTIRFQGYLVGALPGSGTATPFGPGLNWETRSTLVVNGSTVDTCTLQYDAAGGEDLQNARWSQTLFALINSWGAGVSRVVKMENYNEGDCDARFFRRFILAEEVS